MESSIVFAENVKNQRISTKEVTDNIEIGDYIMLDDSWIQITESHLLLVRKIF